MYKGVLYIGAFFGLLFVGLQLITGMNNERDEVLYGEREEGVSRVPLMVDNAQVASYIYEQTDAVGLDLRTASIRYCEDGSITFSGVDGAQYMFNHYEGVYTMYEADPLEIETCTSLRTIDDIEAMLQSTEEGRQALDIAEDVVNDLESILENQDMTEAE